MAVVNCAAIGLAAVVLGIPAAGAIAVVNIIGAYVPYPGSIVVGMIGLILDAPALAVTLDVKDELTTAGFFDKLSSADDR